MSGLLADGIADVIRRPPQILHSGSVTLRYRVAVCSSISKSQAKSRLGAELMRISTAQAGVDGAELARPRESAAKNYDEQAQRMVRGLLA